MVLHLRQFLKAKYRDYFTKVLKKYNLKKIISLSAPLYFQLSGTHIVHWNVFLGQMGGKGQVSDVSFLSFLRCKVFFMDLSVFGFHNLLMQNRLRRAMNVTNHMLLCLFSFFLSFFIFFLGGGGKIQLPRRVCNLAVN